MQILKKLEFRIYEISYKKKLSHIQSCITALPIIYNIYSNLKKEDKFILSSGHAGLALYVVLEHFYNISAEELYEKHGTHPNRDLQNHILCSSGSLGCGITIATGLALADSTNTINCLISDGELAEGSVYEALRFIKNNNLNNIKIYVNFNGFSALDKVDKNYTKKLCNTICNKIVFKQASKPRFSFLNNLDGHYHVLTEEQFNLIKKYYEKRIF